MVVISYTYCTISRYRLTWTFVTFGIEILYVRVMGLFDKIVKNLTIGYSQLRRDFQQFQHSFQHSFLVVIFTLVPCSGVQDTGLEITRQTRVQLYDR
nr:MAG TPA: hypothetical protein [Caudoviricetes sp.]